jgi:hypothetical protein
MDVTTATRSRRDTMSTNTIDTEKTPETAAPEAKRKYRARQKGHAREEGVPIEEGGQ